MNVSEKEAGRLLRDAQKATEAIEAAKAARREAVAACMEAGIARQRIAEALGVDRTRLYQITKGE